MNKEEVKKIADLARIEMTDEELLKMSSEIDSVLAYVDQLKTAAGEDESSVIESATVRNVFREGDLSESSVDRKLQRQKLLKEAPEIEGDFVKVKKIL